MRAWAAEQDWLTLERLSACAPELNPVEPLWLAVKTRELANLVGDHLADVADAAERGIHNPSLTTTELAKSPVGHISLARVGQGGIMDRRFML